MENNSETINNEKNEIIKKVFDKFDKVFDKFDKVFDKFDKVFDKDFDKDFDKVNKMKEFYCIKDKRVTPCTEPSGYQQDKRGRTQFFCRCGVCGNRKLIYL